MRSLTPLSPAEITVHTAARVLDTRFGCRDYCFSRYPAELSPEFGVLCLRKRLHTGPHVDFQDVEIPCETLCRSPFTCSGMRGWLYWW